MSANPIWIAGYFGPVAGAAPVWIAPGDGTVPSAVQSEVVSYFAPVAGATAVWIAGFFAPPPAAIGATPITISGWGGSGAAPTNSPQALAYLARTVGGNEGGNGANIATLIDGLVSDGVWAKLDCLYVLAQQNATDALLNLVGTSYGLTPTNNPPFASYVGFGPFDGVNGYLDTGFNSTIAGSPKYTLNSASFGAWSKSIAVETVAQMGTDWANSTNLLNDYTGGLFYVRVNAGNTSDHAANAGPGLYIGDRSGATSLSFYYNGNSLLASADASIAMDNSTFLIGAARNQSAASAQTLSAAFIGASLGAAGQLALYNRLRTYMTAVGVP